MVDARKESCPTKTLLLAAWQSAAEIYSQAVSQLSKQIGVLSKEDYERLKDFAEESRQRSIDAQTKLEAHIAEHGCGGNGGEVAA